MVGFRQMLAERQESVKSLVCVGLDPLPEKMPRHLSEKTGFTHRPLLEWMKKIVYATAPYACMYKPQSAHWYATRAHLLYPSAVSGNSGVL